MRNLINSILIIILLIIVQLANHKIFINPYASQWGATNAELSATMPYDDQADFIVSTRAITIHKPLDETWLWLNQLGADRAGFFSYYFIERAMGYFTLEQNIVRADFPPFTVGNVVRGSISPQSSLILYDFPVIGMQNNEYFTLANWGTFQVKTIDKQSTRLIIRTHGVDKGSALADGVNYIAYALHYIMERATMNGLKKRIEMGEGAKFSSLADSLWFSFIVISGLLIGLFIFVLRGAKAVILPFILSSVWLITLFTLPPSPIYSGTITAMFLLYFIYNARRERRIS